jgi:hypothetical protein
VPVINGILQADGAVVEILVAPSRSKVQALQMAGSPIPAAVAARAVVDTGADCTSIDPQVLRPLGLPVKAFTLANMPAAGGRTLATQYDISLTILHPSGDRRLHLVIHDLLVVELPLGVLGYQALIGRDVLALGDFHYKGKAGSFTLTY